MIHCLADERLEKLASLAGKKRKDRKFKKGFIWLPAGEVFVLSMQCSLIIFPASLTVVFG